jgi:hypothetical protein
VPSTGLADVELEASFRQLVQLHSRHNVKAITDFLAASSFPASVSADGRHEGLANEQKESIF